MVSRGSSIHHTRRTSNPFMTTSSGIVGINLAEKVAFDAPRLPSARFETASSNNQPPANHSVTDFMYQTTSRQLGDSNAHERSKLSQRMDKRTLRRGATRPPCCYCSLERMGCPLKGRRRIQSYGIVSLGTEQRWRRKGS